MCEVSLDPPRNEKGHTRFDLPQVEVDPGETVSERLRRLCEEGYRVRYPDDPREARERLEYELQAMSELGFEEYHLVVHDFIQWSRNNGVRVGAGRGSGAGSIVVYCLGITDVDPLRHGLIFERYINPARVSAPDLDIDFDPFGRDRVVQYCIGKYGSDHVAHIAAYGSMHAKGSIHAVGRVLALAPEWRREIAEGLPDDQGEFRTTIEEILADPNSHSAKLLLSFVKKAGPTAERMIDLCRRMDDVKTHRSEHAAGIVISGRPLRELVPLVCHDRDNPDRLTTEVPFKYLEDIGLLKMDFLGILGLTIVDKAVRAIREKLPDFDLPPEWEERYDDPKAYEIFHRGDLAGIWQMSSPGMRRLCVELQPNTIDDIASVIALYRPGPLDYVDPDTGLNMVEVFVRRKQGRLAIEYDHPSLEPILRSTYGILVFQEQIMFLTQVFCGWTMAEADALRKAVGKKLPEEMAKLEGKFVEDAVRFSSVHRGLAEKLWQKIVTFARYSFNKSHSLAYGKLGYQMAWLKAHHPKEFLAACLAVNPETNDKDERDGDRRTFVLECNRLGIPVLLPDLVLSKAETVVEGESIRLGFNLVKGIAKAALDIERAQVAPSDTVQEAIRKLVEVKVGPAKMKLLARVGAFARWGNQNQISSLIESYSKSKTSKKRLAAFFGLTPELPEEKPPTARQVDADLSELLSLSLPRREAPPPKQVVYQIRDEKDLAKLSGLEPGPTEVKIWVPIGKKRTFALVSLGRRSISTRQVPLQALARV